MNSYLQDLKRNLKVDTHLYIKFCFCPFCVSTYLYHYDVYPTASRMNIDEMYANLCQLEEEGKSTTTNFDNNDALKEDFWREMEHSDDPFETICFYMSKGYLENI